MFEAKVADAHAAGKDLPLPSPPRDSPPPSYTINDSNFAGTPDVTAAFSNLNLSPSRTPTADQCIAHLKLLECFHQLREDVALKDGMFGLEDSFSNGRATERERTELLTKIREKRWAIYVARAAKRFQTWWESCVGPSAQMLKQKYIASALGPEMHHGPALLFDRDNLPPLGR